MVVIVDYGMGNLGSIQNMLKKVGCFSIISSKYEHIANAKKLILPGVGAFDTGIRNLIQLNLIDILNQKVLTDRIPILGICLGVQLMTQSSEEGSLNGLGWFDAKTVRFNTLRVQEKLLLPNIGWREVTPKKESKLIDSENEELRYYFVHSYHLETSHNEDVLFTSNYGYEYAVALERDNILGVQFHPEKSHKFGMMLLKKFVDNY